MAVHVEDVAEPSTEYEVGDKNVKATIAEDMVPTMIVEAREATNDEHEMTLWQAIKLYRVAVMYSVIFSSAIIMEGYDVVLLGSLYAQPQFAKKYGTFVPGKPGTPGTFQLSAAWQSGLSNGANVGEILGLFLNGIISERYGYRKTMMGSLVLTVAFIFIPVFAQNVQTLQAGEILMGIPWGVYQTLTVTFGSEFCPVALRPYLTTYVNACWVIGQLIASIVLRVTLNSDGAIAYRLPFALQWMWPVPIFIGVYFAPESPWWLVRKGRTEDAVKSVKRMTRNTSDYEAEKTVAMIVHTTELERKITAGTSYWDLFKGVDLRRTEIACFTWSIQNFCSSFQGYSTYFFEQAGLNPGNSFDMSIGLYAIGLLGTIISWFLMQKLGRRDIYLYGIVIMDVCLLLIGFLTLAPASNTGAKWGIAVLLLLETFFYDCTVGSVCYALVPELASGRLRIKSTVMARNIYNVIGIVNGVLVPHMINPTSWNWGAKAGFFYGGCVFLCGVWTFFRLPEPKDRTYAEIDEMFARGIPARKFKSTKIDVFANIDENGLEALEVEKPAIVN